MVHEVLRSLFDPALRADPFPTYAQLREVGSVTLPYGPMTVVGRYQDCLSVLNNPDVSNDRRKSSLISNRQQLTGKGTTPLLDKPMFLFLDPPDHTRLRHFVSRAFTPRNIGRLEPLVRKEIDDALDRIADKGSCELLADLAIPLPVAIICHMVGVPLSDQGLFSAWATHLARSLDPLTGFAPDEQASVRVKKEITEYFQELIARRRKDPGEDLFSTLVTLEEAGDQLTEDELISTSAALVMAGFETTVNLVANGVLALLRNPHEWEALAADPNRASGVVEETLRYDPPVHMVSRVAMKQMHLAGTIVEPGSFILLVVGAAGRDPALVRDPDVFDGGRRPSKHLAFSSGPHFCLGAAIARMEGRLAFTRLTQRLHQPALTDAPLRYKENVSLRGLIDLPLTYSTIAPRTLPWPT